MKASQQKRWWGAPTWERWRLFVWRHRGLLSVTYLLVVAAMPAFLWLYPRAMPHGLDLGLTVGLRNWLHQRSFVPVQKARREVERGDLARARARLEAFLGDHGDCQPGQMYTQAVSDAAELLAEIHATEGRMGRSERTLEEAVLRTPLHWRLWARLGATREERGDFAGAAEAFHQAFKLTLDLPEVTEPYLEVLGETGQHERILWVWDHFERARAHRTAPLVEVKAGPPRSELERDGLSLAGIPVEHGAYTRSLRRFGLERGDSCRLDLPGELLAGYEKLDQTFLQLRFHNVYDELRILGLQWTDAEGRREDIALAEDQVAVLHREGSGGDHHVELRFRLPGAPSSLSLHYACPAHELSEKARSIVDGARRNLAVRAGR